jgi:hypothetical protein
LASARCQQVALRHGVTIQSIAQQSAG